MMRQIEKLSLAVIVLLSGILTCSSATTAPVRSSASSSWKSHATPDQPDSEQNGTKDRKWRLTPDAEASDVEKPPTLVPGRIQQNDRGRENDDWTGLLTYSLALPGIDSRTLLENRDRLRGMGDASKNSANELDVGGDRWGDRVDAKRKWSSGNLAMWGKRKWTANNMGMWGKRDSEKRRWNGNSMAMWGKRDLDGSELNEKRRWNGNSMAMWGKRGMDGSELDEEKRRWNGNSMAMWGKRGLDGSELDEEKRRWNGNGMPMWGKRDSGESELVEEKRRWNGNGMAMWGKRDLNETELDEKKRKWSGSNMAMWGKRDIGREKRKRSVSSDAETLNGSDNEWQRVARGWSGNNLAMWGKRDTPKKLSR